MRDFETERGTALSPRAGVADPRIDERFWQIMNGQDAILEGTGLLPKVALARIMCCHTFPGTSFTSAFRAVTLIMTRIVH